MEINPKQNPNQNPKQGSTNPSKNNNKRRKKPNNKKVEPIVEVKQVNEVSKTNEVKQVNEIKQVNEVKPTPKPVINKQPVVTEKQPDFKVILDQKENLIKYLENSLIERESLIQTIIEESVPKEILRSEDLIERINWWYRDLKGWQKAIAHVSLLLIIACLIFGVYSGVIDATTGDQLISIGVTIVLSLFGLNLQTVALKDPKAPIE